MKNLRFARGFIASVCVALASLNSLATEGFHPVQDKKKLPASLLEIEKNTVAIWNEVSHHIGSAVLIRTTSIGNQRMGYFLTAYHVLENCLQNHTCDRSHILHHYRLPTSLQTSSGAQENPVPMNGAWDGYLQTVVATNLQTDLAIFSIRLSQTAKVVESLLPTILDSKDYQALPHDQKVVFAIGNPSPRARMNWGTQNRVTSPVTYWSAGQIDWSIPLTESVATLWSTADALPGSSGGPLVDFFGRWIGLVKMITKSEGNIYRPSSRTGSIPAQAIAEFLAGAL